ncbi:unnamed protein product [Closterium sp. NIES-65]|nr:unnamed protein product [Closterium sp. NIES-65]
MPASHECPRATVGDAVVLLCPLCAKAVRLVGDEDPNVTWARHERSGCDPSNLQRVANTRSCVAQRCTQALFPPNTVAAYPSSSLSSPPHLPFRLPAEWPTSRCAAQGGKEVRFSINNVTSHLVLPLPFSPLPTSSPPPSRVANKCRCAAQGCKEVLSPANTVTTSFLIFSPPLHTSPFLSPCRVANKCRCAAQGCTEVLSPANTVSLLFSPLRASSPPLYRVTIKRRVANKRRCAAQGCKEVLSPANTVTCRDCSRQTCLRHRFGADHACSGSQKNLQPVSFWAAGGAYSEKLMAGVQGAMAGLMAPAGGAAGAGSSSGVGGSGAGKSAGKNTSTGVSACSLAVMLGLVVQWQGGAEAVQVGRVVAKGLSNAQDAGNVFPTLWLWFGMLRKIMKVLWGLISAQ